MKFTRFLLSTNTTKKTFIPSTAYKRKTAEEAVNNILYNTKVQISESAKSRRILSALVTNEPGVLSRVSGILAGRGFNIDSLVVSSTDVKELSRMTIVVRGEGGVVEQARKQLEDMVPVWAVLDYTDVSVIERELLLVRVQTGNDQTRESVVTLTRLFDGRVVDMNNNLITVELSAKKSRIDAFLSLMKPYGIQEAIRSGIVALPRAKTEHEDDIEGGEDSTKNSVDATLLPPG